MKLHQNELDGLKNWKEAGFPFPKHMGLSTIGLRLQSLHDNFERYSDEDQIALLKVLHPGWLPNYHVLAALVERTKVNLDEIEKLNPCSHWFGFWVNQRLKQLQEEARNKK